MFFLVSSLLFHSETLGFREKSSGNPLQSHRLPSENFRSEACTDQLENHHPQLHLLPRPYGLRRDCHLRIILAGFCPRYRDVSDRVLFDRLTAVDRELWLIKVSFDLLYNFKYLSFIVTVYDFASSLQSRTSMLCATRNIRDLPTLPPRREAQMRLDSTYTPAL